MRNVSSFIALLPLVGCLSAPTNESSSISDVTATPAAPESAACATLDYGHTRANADYFQTFASDEDAFAYAKEWLALIGKPAPTEVSRDPHLTALVREVYAGFRAVYPRETEGFESPPTIVIVDSADVNAFAGFDDRPEVQKAPWLFFIHSGTLNGGFDDAEMRGLFAHELAHLLLRNVLPETRAKIRVHYLAARGAEPLASEVKDDATVRARVEEVRRLGRLVGRFPELDAIPIGLMGEDEPEYYRLLGWLRTQRPDPAPAACQASSDVSTRLQTFLRAHADLDTFSIALDDAAKTELSATLGELSTAMHDCYGHLRVSLLEAKVRAELVGVPEADAQPLVDRLLDPTSQEHAALVSALDPAEVEADSDEATPTVDRILRAVKALHAKLAALEADAKLPLDEVRVYDKEEDADDAAVRILAHLGEDPTAQGRFSLRTMKDPAACRRDVDAGKDLFYGRFVDPHNATCWRYKHVVEFAKAISSCGAARTTTQSRPSALVTISPYDSLSSHLHEQAGSATLLNLDAAEAIPSRAKWSSLRAR